MIYFISGHRDLSYEEFEKYYVPKIEEVIKSDPFAEFLVGDCDMLPEQLNNFVHTDYRVGLTEDDVNKAIKILNNYDEH